MRNLCLFILPALFFACAPVRFVEPLDKGTFSVGGNFGGPLIEYPPAVIPVPFLAVEGGYGVDTNLTVHGGLNLTSAIFGNVHVDGGITYRLVEQKKYIPNVSVSPSFQLVWDVYDHKATCWPVVDANAYWNYGVRKNYFYTGINNYFDLSKTMANDLPVEHRWLFSPQFGHVLKSKSGNFQFTAEIKLCGVFLNSKYSFIPWTGITADAGATGVYFGFRWLIPQH